MNYRMNQKEAEAAAEEYASRTQEKFVGTMLNGYWIERKNHFEAGVEWQRERSEKELAEAAVIVERKDREISKLNQKLITAASRALCRHGYPGTCVSCRSPTNLNTELAYSREALKVTALALGAFETFLKTSERRGELLQVNEVSFRYAIKSWNDASVALRALRAGDPATPEGERVGYLGDIAGAGCDPDVP